MQLTAQFAVIVPVLIVVIDIARRLVQRRRERKSLPLPPGPPQIPIAGNALSINREEPWKTYTKWHAVYGDVLYLRLVDQDVIVIGSRPVAVELLEKRSKLYADRPSVATSKPYGIDRLFAFIPYGDYWRLCRRIFHQTYHANAALSFRPMQLYNARQLVKNMIEDPDRYQHHYLVFSITLPLSTVYHYEPSAQGDPIVRTFEDFAAAAVPAAMPEHAILLKLFPFLLHVPDWFPGSWLKHEAKRARDLSEKLTELPFRYVEERMLASDGRTIACMVSDHLTRARTYNASYRAKYISVLKDAAVTSLFGSAETTTTSLMVFTLAMVLHPYVWKRAQAEIDAVIGTDRLPDFSDRPALPYVDAIIRETVRWVPVVPLIWHATSESDVYNGYYIPKGASVVANAWAMSRDESRFPNAEDFVPERYLDDQGTLNDNNPMDFVFGFGRRICAGRYAADGSLWSAIATMLSTLDFYPTRDAQGNDLPVEVKWLNGIAPHPEAFPCRISPRACLNLESYMKRVPTEIWSSRTRPSNYHWNVVDADAVESLPLSTNHGNAPDPSSWLGDMWSLPMDHDVPCPVWED